MADQIDHGTPVVLVAAVAIQASIIGKLSRVATLFAFYIIAALKSNFICYIGRWFVFNCTCIAALQYTLAVHI